jgi:PTH1 family peptidyl-tRNA hydrolase
VVKLVAGLGNPGPRYAESRHNVGFLVVDELARRWRLGEPAYDRRCDGLLREADRGGERILLLQPQTYMNLSGRSVAALWRYYKLTLTDLLVVVDDLDLPVGNLRLRPGGSSGGHHGLTDAIRHLGTDEFPRLRIGIGKVDHGATVEYVLGRFEPHERAAIVRAVESGADAIECWRARGLEAAMNEFNRPRDGRARTGPSPANGPAKGDGS